MQKKLLFIKLGGSIITDKTVEQSVQLEVVRDLISQIKEIHQSRTDLHVVVGHGQGSFAHFPAKKYRINEGFVDGDSLYGLAVTLDVVAKLNRIIVSELLAQQLPAISLFPSQIALTKAGQPFSTSIQLLEEYIKLGLVPVITGDALVDVTQGCSIWSADFSLPYFASLLRDRGWDIESVIHVTKTPGVYVHCNSPEKGIFEHIQPDDFGEVSKQLAGSQGVDVTGGMLEKVRQAVELARQGISTVIMNNEDHNLVRHVCAGEAIGTKIA